MKAVVVTSKGQTELQDFPVPEASSGHVVVKTTAIALNPTDWKHRDFVAPPGSWLGCDFCGTVESVGDGVSHLQKGDRVAAFVHGGQWPGEGSFAEYVKVQASLVWKVPETIGDEEAAAAGGIGPWTAIQALFFRLPIDTPWNPNKEGEPFLVWGGATSVGLYAIQLLKLSGYTVVTTASEKNAELLKSLGATAVYSYSDKDTPAKIAKDYPTLRYALDTIAEGKTTVGAVKSIWDAAGMGKVITLLVNKDDELKQYKDKVPAEMTLVYTVLGVAFDWPGVSFPEMPEDKRQMEEWCAKHIPEHIASGKLKPNPIKTFDGGLANITEGLDYIKAGKNRAQKVTYKI